MSFHHVFRTAFGLCGIAWNEHGICRFLLPMPNSAAETLAIRLPGPAALPSGQVAEAVAAAVRYYAGERVDFSGLNVDLSGAESFERAVYAAARCLDYGETTTYGALAAQIDYPGAARATGAALGRNPVPLIVPCHRVVAAGGRLGGFSAPGGATTKRRMLALERAAPPPAEPAQGSFAF